MLSLTLPAQQKWKNSRKHLNLQTMSCNKSKSAVITFTLAAGSTASPYFGIANISQRLCQKTCADETPVFAPRFSLVGYSAVGTNEYVATVHVEGIICYAPCGTNGCCNRTQTVSQDFTIPFYSTAVPTAVTIEQGAVVNSLDASACQTCSRSFVSETPITLTVTAAAA